MSALRLVDWPARRSLNALAVVVLGLSSGAWDATNAQVKEAVAQPAKAQAKAAGATAKPTKPRESVSSADEVQPKGRAELSGSSDENASTRVLPADVPEASDLNLPVNNDDQQTEGWTRYLGLKYLFIFFGVVVVAVGIFYIWSPGRNRSGAGADGLGRKRMTGPGGSSPPRDGVYAPNVSHQTAVEIDQLRNAMRGLLDEFEQLKRQVDMLRAKIDGNLIVEPMRSAAESAYQSLDRRDSRVTLPEDERQIGVLYGSSYPRESQTAAATNQPSTAPFKNDQLLVDRYNEAVKPNEISDLADELGAQFYTNERSGDISNLLKSEFDRFWLVPMPDQPDTAWLVPGFTVRKGWQKFRQFASDHPLAHHFDLLQGDKFMLHRAAVVRKDLSGEWQLVSKGEVSGIL